MLKFETDLLLNINNCFKMPISIAVFVHNVHRAGFITNKFVIIRLDKKTKT